MRNARDIDNYPGSGEPHRVPAVRGLRVLIFNEVSDDFTGTIQAMNKKCARIRHDERISPFTLHPEARAPRDDEFLVPWHCIRVAPPASDDETPSASR